MLQINTNADSLAIHRNLITTGAQLSQSLQRLSSGLRINSAADDAAGLSISEKLRAQVRGLNQASRNAQDGISLLQTAESALDSTSGVLQRMRELSVQAANDTLTSNDRTAIQNEINQLLSDVDRIANNTQFNTKNLLDGTLATTALSLQVGANAAQVITFTIGTMNSAALTVNGLAVTVSATAASAAIVSLDSAIQAVSAQRSQIGALENRLQRVISNLDASSQMQTTAESRIRDADVATETTNLVRNQILQQAGVAVLAQANRLPESVLTLLR